MPHNSSKQILAFYSKQVALPSDERSKMRGRRNTNRDRMKKGLADAEKPAPSAMYTQGSYAMWTMVQDESNDYDIDDGAYFYKEKLVGPKGGELSALSVRQMVCDAVQDDRFSTSPKVLKNCVRVFYNEGYHVDIPCYRILTSKNAWSGEEDESYELASTDWKKSDAREVTTWFADQNKQQSDDYDTSDGQLLRIVCLLKKFSKSRASWKSLTATGFMISKLVTEHFFSSPGRDDLSFRQTAKAIKLRLDYNATISHPVLTGESITREEDGRPIYFRDCLNDNLSNLDVLDGSPSHNDAMAAWDKFFSTEWFSEQPPPSDDRDSGGSSPPSGGTPKKPVEKQGGGRYARPGPRTP